MNNESLNDDQIKAEFFTAAGIVGAAGFGLKVGEKAYRYLKSKDPLVLQVLDSVSHDDEAQVVIQISNQTLHGIYIEKITIEKPEKNNQLKFYEWKTDYNKGNLSQKEWLEFEWCPLNIAPGDDFYFAVRYKKPPNKKITSGKMKIKYSRLDQGKPENKPYVFLIR